MKKRGTGLARFVFSLLLQPRPKSRPGRRISTSDLCPDRLHIDCRQNTVDHKLQTVDYIQTAEHGVGLGTPLIVRTVPVCNASVIP